jgi:hypothetical protein
MSNPASLLARLPEAVTQTAVMVEQQAGDNQIIIQTLLEMTEDLLSFTKRDTILGKGDPDPDPYKPSLGSLYARIQAGCIPPSPTAVGASPKKRIKIHKRTSKAPVERSLPDFEDIYYALLALVQEMHWDLLTRVNNGFNSVDDYVCADGFPLWQLIEYLVKGWTFLNEPRVAKALDDAIRQACYKTTQKKFRDDFREGKYLAKDYKDLLKALKQDYHEIPGLTWIGGWSPAMINAALQQKWRPVYSAERMDKVRKVTLQKMEVAQMAQRRISAERREREDMLKSKLREEAVLQQAQRPQEGLQTPTRHEHEQKQADHTQTARATLVSEYMENLHSAASPHAKHLVHGTGYDRPPFPFSNLGSPSASKGTDNGHFELGSPPAPDTLTFEPESPSYAGYANRLSSKMKKSYFVNGSALEDPFGPDAQQYVAGAGPSERQSHPKQEALHGRYTNPGSQSGDSTVMAHCDSPSLDTGHGSMDLDTQREHTNIRDPQTKHEKEPPPAGDVNLVAGQNCTGGDYVPDGSTTYQLPQGFHDVRLLQGDHTRHGVQEVSSSAQTHSVSDGNALLGVPQDTENVADTCHDHRHCIQNVEYPQNTSAYLAQQGFNMEGLVQAREHVQEGASGIGDGDVDMDVDDDHY